jgi:hypothetical protein
MMSGRHASYRSRQIANFIKLEDDDETCYFSVSKWALVEHIEHSNSNDRGIDSEPPPGTQKQRLPFPPIPQHLVRQIAEISFPVFRQPAIRAGAVAQGAQSGFLPIYDRRSHEFILD